LHLSLAVAVLPIAEFFDSRTMERPLLTINTNGPRAPPSMCGTPRRAAPPSKTPLLAHARSIFIGKPTAVGVPAAAAVLSLRSKVIGRLPPTHRRLPTKFRARMAAHVP
jgi:hypothetical protein